MQKTKVLIVGCGDVGTRLARRLIDQGHQIVGLRRTPPLNNMCQIPYFPADVTAVESLSQLDTDFDQVVYAVSPDRRDEKHYRDIYETGLKYLFAHFSKNKTKPHWMFVSSTAVYGETNGTWIDESSPTRPRTPVAKILLEAENRILKHHLQNIIVRFSGIYGEGRERLLRIANDGTPVQAEPPYYRNGIHQEDAAGVLAFLLEKRLSGAALDNCYIATDDRPAPLQDIVSWLAKALHGGTAVAKPKDKTDGMNKRCANARLKKLGYVFQYPSYREGYAPLVAAWRKKDKTNKDNPMTHAERKACIQKTFNDVSARYDRNRFFSMSAQHLLDAASFSGRGRMLDLCTGTGNVALQAGARWPDLNITAIDLSEGMLTEARKKAAELGRTNVDFMQQDVETLKKSADDFDLITCAYGLFFFPQIENTFRNLFNRLKPGGIFVFSSFTKVAFSPYEDRFLEQLKPYGIEVPKPAGTRLKTREEIRALCEAAGVEDLEILSREIRYPVSIDDWWSLIDSAGYKGLLNELGPEHLPDFKAAHMAAVEKDSQNGKLELVADSWYGIARRSG